MAALGLLILIAAVIIGAVVGLANSGSDHLVTDFTFLGNEISASTGRLFLYGAALGAAAMLGLNMLLAGLGRGLKNKVKNRREMKDQRHQNESLAAERARLEQELQAERAAHQDQEAVDITDRNRVDDDTTVGRHQRH